MASRASRLTQLAAAGIIPAVVGPVWAADPAFVHLGLLHTSADLARIKNAVAARQEPIYGGYQQLLAHADSQLTYRMQGPLPAVGRATDGAGGQAIYDHDATAAYHLALLWAITGQQAYADRSKTIVDAWSSTLQTINGRDAVLMAGLGPFKMINAAEILRYTNCGWGQKEALQAEKCFKQAIYPTIKDFALYANGNWDTAAMKTVIAIGVYTNDREIFENGMRYYVDGAGDGALTHYILNDAGQCQESGRDAGHWQLGIGHLGDCAEIAWNQGLDLYGLADNRLLKGFEYAARYNFGDGNVPFVPTLDRTGKYPHASISAKGPVRPIYEQIYGHYVKRLGITSPALETAIRQGPEGASSPIGDHPGFGTLLFSRTGPTPGENPRTAARPPAAPAAVIARGSTSQVDLTWVASNTAESYSVKRGAKSGGPYTVVGSNIRTASFSDKSVRPGELYYYVVSASNARGQSADSWETGISAGMPGMWKDEDIGEVKLKGWAKFDGRVFTLDGSGKDIEGSGGSDQFHFTYALLRGDGSITARFVPQMSGMRTKFGLMIREDLTPAARNVSLIVGPAGNDAETPGYAASLLCRPAVGVATNVFARHEIPSPFVTDGRFMEPYWFRLTRAGDRFSAFVSIDGLRWKQLGTNPSAAGTAATGVLQLPMKDEVYVGLPVCSCILQKVGEREIPVDTVVKMDNVSVTGWKTPGD